MIETEQGDKPAGPSPVGREERKAIDPQLGVPEPRASLPSIGLDDCRDVGLTKDNLETVEKTFTVLGQQSPQQLRSQLMDWSR
jgi:hypothetical protein